MSISINKITLVGNVGTTPEVQEVNGYAVANFSLATSTGGFKKSDGTEVPEKTQWHRIVAWRGLAKLCAKIQKGDRVVVLGSVEYNTYEKEGQKFTYTNIVATDIIPPKTPKESVPTPAPVVVVGSQAPTPKAPVEFNDYGNSDFGKLPF